MRCGRRARRESVALVCVIVRHAVRGGSSACRSGCDTSDVRRVPTRCNRRWTHVGSGRLGCRFADGHVRSPCDRRSGRSDVARCRRHDARERSSRCRGKIPARSLSRSAVRSVARRRLESSVCGRRDRRPAICHSRCGSGMAKARTVHAGISTRPWRRHTRGYCAQVVFDAVALRAVAKTPPDQEAFISTASLQAAAVSSRFLGG
jgi:hypothetical protein